MISIDSSEDAMLHLFKKTYLDIDSFIDPNIDRIVISKIAGNEFYSKFQPYFLGKLYNYGHELEDLLGEGKSFNDFVSMLDFCANHNEKLNKKVVIYCDKDAFYKICALWFKMIFKTPQSQSSFNIIKAYFNKQMYISNVGAFERANDQVNYESFGIQESEFEQVFNLASVPNSDDFFNKIKNSLSLEYHLASYYFDGSYKIELKNIVKKMLLRQMDDLSKDAWKIISCHIANKKFREKIGVNSNYNTTNYSDALFDARFNSLRSFGAHLPYNDHWSSVHLSPDVQILTDSQIEEIKDQILKCYRYPIDGLSGSDTETHSHFFKNHLDISFSIIRSNSFSDEDFEKIISSDKMMINLEKFYAPIDKRTVNFYLVDIFVELKNSNQQHLLSGYVLK